MRLQACVNGARLPVEHPALPVTPAQLARAAVGVANAGAGAVYLHVKDDEGRDTFDPARVAASLLAVRAACPHVPVGLTTAIDATGGDAAERMRLVASWTLLPDFASVNWVEDRAEDLAKALLDRGVAVEAGLFTRADVEAWAESAVAAGCARAMVELLADEDEETARELVSLVRASRPDVPVVLHGVDSNFWPLLDFAGRLGLIARAGLEDVLLLPERELAPDNVALVRAAAEKAVVILAPRLELAVPL